MERSLAEEAANLQGFLLGRTVRLARPYRKDELIIEFTDDMRLRVDRQPDRSLEFSIQGGPSDDED